MACGNACVSIIEDVSVKRREVRHTEDVELFKGGLREQGKEL